MTTSKISDELYDEIFIYKLFSNPSLLESLKRIENIVAFKAIEEFYVKDLGVSIFLLLKQSNMLFLNII